MYLYYYNITASLEDELEPVLLSLGLFSAKPYIHKQNRNEISVHFLVKVSHQENMCCLDCTCIRLFYVFCMAGLWTLLVATIVLISNISFDNKGKAATLFDILCWCFSNKLTLGVLVFKVDVVFFCSETYNKKCKNILIFFLVSLLMISMQNNKTYLICNLCKRNVIIVFVSFTIVGAGTCVFQVWRQTLWRQWYTKFVPLSQLLFLFLRSEFCLYDMNCFQKRKSLTTRNK